MRTMIMYVRMVVTLAVAMAMTMTTVTVVLVMHVDVVVVMRIVMQCPFGRSSSRGCPDGSLRQQRTATCVMLATALLCRLACRPRIKRRRRRGDRGR